MTNMPASRYIPSPPALLALSASLLAAAASSVASAGDIAAGFQRAATASPIAYTVTGGKPGALPTTLQIACGGANEARQAREDPTISAPVVLEPGIEDCRKIRMAFDALQSSAAGRHESGVADGATFEVRGGGIGENGKQGYWSWTGTLAGAPPALQAWHELVSNIRRTADASARP